MDLENAQASVRTSQPAAPARRRAWPVAGVSVTHTFMPGGSTGIKPEAMSSTRTAAKSTPRTASLRASAVVGWPV